MEKNQKSKMTIMLPIIFGASIYAPEILAQFSKYKSKTKFNSNVPVPSNPSVIDSKIPNTDPTSSSTLLDKLRAQDSAMDSSEMDSDGEEFDGGDEGSGDAFANAPSGADSFGRNNSAAKPAEAKQKYVNLNPETAFGPEVVTSFDFPNISIIDLTKHMQKLTGLNLIIDDKEIKGKISISAPTPITVGDAWKAYLQALNINGLSLVKNGAFYTIINNRDIRYAPTSMYTGNFTPEVDNYILKIIQLKYVSAEELTKAFRPFMSRYGRILEMKQTNTVIIQETGNHILRLMKLVKFIDVPGHDETLQIIAVKNSSAQEIAGLLDKILKGNDNNRFRPASSTQGKSQSNISRIIAEPRTNSIIAMANADGATQLKELIAKLDVKLVASGSGQIHVYYLRHGDAETLSQTLSSLVSGNAKSGAATRLSSLPIPSVGGATATTGNLFNNEVKITADKSNNALVVTASPTDYLTLKTVIDRLDVPRDQVYVEGLIMETQVSKSSGFGIGLIGAYGSGGAAKAGFGATGDLINLMTNNITNLSGFFAGTAAGKQVTLNTPDGKSVQVNSVNGIIKAIATHGSTNVLATPQILTMDNVEGFFEAGEQVPVEKSTTTNGTIQNSVEDKKVTMSLKITPQINKSTRFVKLKIEQKIEDFSNRPLPKQNGFGTVIRNINTTVVVRDKDTIAMGGLMRDRETNTVNKVPLLGDIPLLGWLFKNTERNVEKVNLLFFLTPKILASYEKTMADNNKELLNRRASHLKNLAQDDEAFNTTVKGLYEKSKRQEEGPLYDLEEAKKYKDSSDQMNDESAAAQAQNETPNYVDIAKEAGNKEL